MRVLVVENDTEISDCIVEILEFHNFTVTRARHGMEALQYLTSAERYDVVLLDLIMPVMNGTELLDAMAKARIQVPVVAMSASQLALKQLSPLSVQATLCKPFDIDQLVRAVNDGMGRCVIERHERSALASPSFEDEVSGCLAERP